MPASGVAPSLLHTEPLPTHLCHTKDVSGVTQRQGRTAQQGQAPQQELQAGKTHTCVLASDKEQEQTQQRLGSKLSCDGTVKNKNTEIDTNP